ncbi:unnamed protein product [Prunus armeniaca]
MHSYMETWKKYIWTYPQNVIQLLTRKIKFASSESHYMGQSNLPEHDDIIVIGNDAEEQLKLQKYLSQEFEMKDLGDLKYFLEIEVARSKTGIFLSQRKYVMDLLTET